MISSSLYIEEENEKMILVTGSSTAHPGADSRAKCNSTFTYETCILEPGAAEYEVEVEGDEILVDSISSPIMISSTPYPVTKTNSSDGEHDSTVSPVHESSTELRMTYVTSSQESC